MKIRNIIENISSQQRGVGQLPADFDPPQTSPQLNGPYPGRNATRGYLVGEDQEPGTVFEPGIEKTAEYRQGYSAPKTAQNPHQEGTRPWARWLKGRIDKIGPRSAQQGFAPRAVSASTAGVAEGSDDIWGPAGRFAGDEKTDIGMTLDKIAVGDQVQYHGRKVRVKQLYKDRARVSDRSREWDVRLSDLNRLGQGVREGSKIAVDRKTGRYYDPDKELDKLLNQNRAQFQGMAAIEKAQKSAQKAKPKKPDVKEAYVSGGYGYSIAPGKKPEIQQKSPKPSWRLNRDGTYTDMNSGITYYRDGSVKKDVAEQGVSEAGVTWHGTRSGREEAAMTDHTVYDAKQYLKANYPVVKTYNVRRAEPGFRILKRPDELRKSEAHIVGVDGAVDYLQLERNAMMSGSSQWSASIGSSWSVYENTSNGIAIIYYQDRGMGSDSITVAGKTPKIQAQARQVFIDAGVLPEPKPRAGRSVDKQGGLREMDRRGFLKQAGKIGAAAVAGSLGVAGTATAADPQRLVVFMNDGSADGKKFDITDFEGADDRQKIRRFNRLIDDWSARNPDVPQPSYVVKRGDKTIFTSQIIGNPSPSAGLREFDAGESGFGPWRLYQRLDPRSEPELIGKYDSLAAAEDEMQEQIFYAAQRNALFYYDIIDGTDERVGGFDPDESADSLRRSRKIQGLEESGWNPLDDERREQRTMDQERERFRRDELEAELGDEEQRAQQIMRGTWYVIIDGRTWQRQGEPVAFQGKNAARRAGQTIKNRTPERTVTITQTLPTTENSDISEAPLDLDLIKRAQGGMAGTNLDPDSERLRDQPYGYRDRAKSTFDPMARLDKGAVNSIERALGIKWPKHRAWQGTVKVDESRDQHYVQLFREAVAAGMTSEDVLTTMKRRLGDYLQDVATAIRKDPDLVDKIPQAVDQIGPAVRTLKTDDGHEIRIHGNEDDGFRVSIRNRTIPSRFRSLDEAEIATEMYCARRRQAAQLNDDYRDEA